MRRLLQKLRCHFGFRGICCLFLILYTTAVMTLRAFHSGLHTGTYVAVTCLVTALLCVVFWPFYVRFFSKVHICPRTEQKKEAVLRQIGINSLFYLIPLAVFLVYFIAYYPGGYSPDSNYQYLQAVHNKYEDWHPVLHTLLAFKLPLLLTGGWEGSVVLLQSLCWCGVIGYTCQVIRKYFGIWPAVITMSYILLNPLVMLTAMHPWKDVGFAVCALLIAAYALQATVTKGEWLKKPLHMICFAVVVVLASIFRHNGILFTVPVVLGMVLYLSRKRGLVLCVGIVMLFAMVKGPVYGLLKVPDHQTPQEELLGLPMTVICTVANESPELVDAETLEFISQLAPEEAWEESFSFGNYNSIKFDKRTNNDIVEEYGAGKVLSMMLRCIKASPKTALRSFLQPTFRLFYIQSAGTGWVYPGVVQNNYVQAAQNPTLSNFIHGYAEKIAAYLGPVFMYLGIVHLLLLSFMLTKLNLKRREDWSKLWITLAVFCYNFGTALLLSCESDVFRFFFYTFPVMPVLLLMLFCNHEERSRPLFARFKK